MPDPSILVSLRGEPGLKVATMTISNPDALNALTTDMQLQFIDAITTLEADDQVRGIIIRERRPFPPEVPSTPWRRSSPPPTGRPCTGGGSKCGTPS